MSRLATDRSERLVSNATLHALPWHVSAPRPDSFVTSLPPGSQVVLLGQGDSGTSPTLKKMRLIHRVRSTTPKIESFHQLVSENLTRGLKYLLDVLPDMQLELSEAYGDIYYEEGCIDAEVEGGRNMGGERRMRTGRRGGTTSEDIAAHLALIDHAEDIADS
ncbi:hypothetical protein B0H14DRAFT_3453251 [Mycena olivaceomarginata]|nr:hypothetical protein B0H14DRAFT_3453251 [Mycena olivaceomarginata]